MLSPTNTKPTNESKIKKQARFQQQPYVDERWPSQELIERTSPKRACTPKPSKG